ncbi:MAG: hypothetical protein K2X43_21065, partial [Hyphomonadaceae bacterium]|nr:hypothetical protein [Hyphomonadaceae bacterium]
MGESAQGPGPGPAEPQEDAGERERVAEARSPVAPPAPGLPSQIPPWPEAEPKDTRAPDPAGGTPAGAEGAEQPPVEDLGRVDHALPAASEMAAAEASGDAPPLEPKPVSETQAESGAISVAIAGGNIEARGRPMEVLAEVEPPAQQPAAPATLEAREMVPAVDVRPRVSQDARPVPIPEEHIWSGPEAEPPEPPVATPPLPARPHDDAHPEPEPPPLPPAPAAAALLGNPRPAAPAPAAGPV